MTFQHPWFIASLDRTMEHLETFSRQAPAASQRPGGRARASWRAPTSTVQFGGIVMRPLARTALVTLLAATLAACTSSSRKFSTFGEASSEWDAAVDRSIQEPARAARVKQLGRELVALQRDMAAELATLDEQAAALNARHDSTAEDAAKLGRAYQEQRRVSFARYRDLVFAIRGEVSAAEWKALMK
jgi:hypothetical protein